MVVLGKSGSVIGLLTFGTISSLVSKIVYEMKSEGLDGHERLFRKPWMMTTIMFIGMTACLPLAYLEERSRPQAQNGTDEAGQPLLEGNGEEKKPRSELKEALMLSIPTVFDLIATILMNIGLLSVTASVYQMMRGAEMVFAAVFAVFFLHRTLNKFHFMGIGLSICGITLVGLSSVMSGQGGTQVAVEPAQILLGMGLIVLSQAVQAAQVTFEDYFMSEMDISAMKIVGFEGMFGSIFMLCIMAPIVRLLPGAEGSGTHEDIVDTWHMITHSRALLGILCLQMFALLAYNYMGMHVTGHLGAVFRTVLETMRTLFVWLLGLALFYLHTGLGERWDHYSFIQAAGFVVLVSGTVIYGRGDEWAAHQFVEDMLEGRTDEEAQLPAPSEIPPVSTAPQSTPSAGISVQSSAVPMPMASPSPMRINQSMAAGSYNEAIASSLRSRGIDPSAFGSVPRGPSSLSGSMQSSQYR